MSRANLSAESAVTTPCKGASWKPGDGELRHPKGLSCINRPYQTFSLKPYTTHMYTRTHAHTHVHTALTLTWLLKGFLIEWADACAIWHVLIDQLSFTQGHTRVFQIDHIMLIREHWFCLNVENSNVCLCPWLFFFWMHPGESKLPSHLVHLRTGWNLFPLGESYKAFKPNGLCPHKSWRDLL